MITYDSRTVQALFFKKVYEFVNAQVDPYVRAGTGSASQRVLGHAVHFDSRFALQNVPSPAECVGKLTPFRPYVHVLQAPFSNMFWGLMQIWWLGFAEPLYGEAGAKAPASHNSLSD